MLHLPGSLVLSFVGPVFNVSQVFKIHNTSLLSHHDQIRVSVNVLPQSHSCVVASVQSALLCTKTVVTAECAYTLMVSSFLQSINPRNSFLLHTTGIHLLNG